MVYLSVYAWVGSYLIIFPTGPVARKGPGKWQCLAKMIALIELSKVFFEVRRFRSALDYDWIWRQALLSFWCSDYGSFESVEEHYRWIICSVRHVCESKKGRNNQYERLNLEASKRICGYWCLFLVLVGFSLVLGMAVSTRTGFLLQLVRSFSMSFAFNPPFSFKHGKFHEYGEKV